jgi:hypothetical protein
MRGSKMWVVAIVLAAVFTAIYGDALGHGFVKDDFRWIAAADVHSVGDLQRIFAANVGFYRPLVTLTFAIDRGAWSLDPRGYAVTNLILLLANAGLLFTLARRLWLSSPVSLFAVAVWMFNFHGINMALLWISGRTALLLCLFSLAAVLAWLRGRRLIGALLTLAAMLSKEEAVMLPPLLVMIDVLHVGDRDRRSTSIRRALLRSWPLWVAATIYLIIRSQSGAFGVSDAPSYYRLTSDPSVILKNAVEYLDRGATWPAVAAVLMFVFTPAATSLDDVERRVIRFGGVWFVLMFAITVFLPVRSSLYAVAPSIGTALAAASFASRAQRAAPHRFARVSTALIVAAAALIPVYRMRNQGLIGPADLSTQATAVLQRAGHLRPGVREIVLIDDPGGAVTLEDAFGALAPDAVHLFVSPDVHVSAGDIRSAIDGTNEDVMVLRLRDGRLVQDRVRTNGSPEDTSASHPG